MSQQLPIANLDGVIKNKHLVAKKIEGVRITDDLKGVVCEEVTFERVDFLGCSWKNTSFLRCVFKDVVFPSIWNFTECSELEGNEFENCTYLRLDPSKDKARSRAISAAKRNFPQLFKLFKGKPLRGVKVIHMSGDLDLRGEYLLNCVILGSDLSAARSVTAYRCCIQDANIIGINCVRLDSAAADLLESKSYDQHRVLSLDDLALTLMLNRVKGSFASHKIFHLLDSSEGNILPICPSPFLEDIDYNSISTEEVKYQTLTLMKFTDCVLFWGVRLNYCHVRVPVARGKILQLSAVETSCSLFNELPDQIELCKFSNCRFRNDHRIRVRFGKSITTSTFHNCVFTGDWNDYDFIGEDYRDIEISDEDRLWVPEMSLERVVFEDCSFVDFTMRRCRFDNVDFIRCTFDHTIPGSRKDLATCTFKNVNFIECKGFEDV